MECKICFRTELDVKEMNQTGRCKNCHNEMNRALRDKEKVERNPELYRDCNDCDRVFYRYRKGKHVNNQEITICTYCKSDNTQAVI